MRVGTYNATIVEHGTDRSSSGLPFVWIAVRINEAGQDEVGTCRIFLAGSTEEKTTTALRMARQALRLCGFDPDTQDVSDLSLAETMLKGNVVPVKIKETPNGKGGFWENWDLVLPRALTKTEASPLTAALRAAKHKDEEPITVKKAPDAKPSLGAPIKGIDPDPNGVNFDDVPFSFLTTLCLVGMSLFA